VTPLLIGTVLALLALAFVLYPLVVAGAAPSAASRARTVRHAERDAASAQGSAIDALREVEFDRATGKLSDADYEALKAAYTSEAIAALRADDSSSAVAALAADDPAEAAVLRYRNEFAVRTCAVHGPRPELDAAYCSDCGRYLAGRCTHCGATVDQLGARFCSECGESLAA
jgi:hypothetical protein